MNKMHKPDKCPAAILFDLDNTLCTFIESKMAACEAVAHAVGAGFGMDLFCHFSNKTRSFEDPENITDYYSGISEWDHAFGEGAKAVFQWAKLETITLYPGVTDVLRLLREHGIPLAVVTDADSDNALARMRKLGIADEFQVLATPDRSGRSKPDHASFLLALDELNVPPEQTWLVGDSLNREMVPGRQLGMTTIYARYGDWIQNQSEPASPDYILDHFTDLITLPGLNHIFMEK